MQLLGIDGCRAGWVIAADTNGLCFTVVTDLSALFVADDTLIAIDMPIGLPDSGPRACDLAARRQLGKGQGGRVFPAPCRAALSGSSYLECCDLSERASGKRLSKQCHAILPKIRAVDAAISPELQRRVREAHPEVSFCVLNGAPLQHTKKGAAGHQERLAILRTHGLTFDPSGERHRLGRSQVAVDDLIDAAVCLLTARRIKNGEALMLGDGTIDARGLRVEIVA